MKEALRILRSSSGHRLLDPEKLDAMKVDNEPLWSEVMAYYRGYLKETLGM